LLSASDDKLRDYVRLIGEESSAVYRKETEMPVQQEVTCAVTFV